MRSVHRVLMCGAALSLLTFWAGPNAYVVGQDAKPAAKPTAKQAEKSGQHAHDSKGPHKGALIELGEEEYHGEIVLDEKTNAVTIYLLGSNAKDAVPIEATEVAINLKHGDKPQQFKLKAAPIKTDPKGKSSSFSLQDKDLMHSLHHKNAQPQLRVKIAGKNFSGKIEIGHHAHEPAVKDKKES